MDNTPILPGIAVTLNDGTIRELVVLDLRDWFEEVFRPYLNKYMMTGVIDNCEAQRGWYTDEDYFNIITDIIMIDVTRSDAHITDYTMISALIQAVDGQRRWESIQSDVFRELAGANSPFRYVRATIDHSLPFIISLGKLVYYKKE